MDKADKVVTVLPEYWNPWMAVVAKQLDHFRHRHLRIEKCRARSRGHDLDDFRIPRLQQVVNQGALGCIELPVLGNLLHQGFELVKMQNIIGGFFLADNQGGDTVGNAANHPDQRRDQPDPQAHGGRNQPGADTHRIRHRDGLRGYLAKQQQQRHHHQHTDQAGTFDAVQTNQYPRHVCGSRNVDQFIAAEDGNNQPPGLIQQGMQGLGVAVAFPAEFLQVQSGEGEQRGFRPGKKSRAKQQQPLDTQADDHIGFCQARGIKDKERLDGFPVLKYFLQNTFH